MKPNRLVILLLVMALLAIGRFALAPKLPDYATAEAVARKPEPRVAAVVTAPAASRPSADEGDVPGNAFSVRVVAPPTPPAPVPVVAPPVVAVAVPLPPVNTEPAPPPPPPLQVIGTYDDGGAPAVFLATPTGTLIARPGSVLMAEYRVTEITAQHVALTQVSTQRSFQLPLPGRAAP